MSLRSSQADKAVLDDCFCVTAFCLFISPVVRLAIEQLWYRGIFVVIWANRKLFRSKLNPRLGNTTDENLLANRTNGPAYATVPSPSVAVVCLRRRLSVTLCIVAKRCVLEQMLLLTVYRK